MSCQATNRALRVPEILRQERPSHSGGGKGKKLKKRHNWERPEVRGQPVGMVLSVIVAAAPQRKAGFSAFYCQKRPNNFCFAVVYIVPKAFLCPQDPKPRKASASFRAR